MILIHLETDACINENFAVIDFYFIQIFVWEISLKFFGFLILVLEHA